MDRVRVSVHPASLPEEELLRRCRLVRERGGGPGGQHRNRVSTGARYLHEPTGVEAHADERRSAEENRRAALRRLRLELAVRVRTPIAAGECRTGLWRSRCTPEGRIVCNARHPDFPALLSEALDVIEACDLDVRRAALRLACTPSQLVGLLQDHPEAWATLNRRREAAGLRALR